MQNKFRCSRTPLTLFVLALFTTVIATEQVVHATGEMTNSDCAPGQNCSNCKLVRGTVTGFAGIQCFASSGGSGSGSVRTCVYDPVAANHCQMEPANPDNSDILTCSGSTIWVCGPQNPVTGDCPFNCPCSGTPTASGGTTHIKYTCT